MESQKGSVIFSIDIECRGQGPWRHGIISIGVCVGSATKEEVIEKRRWDLAPFPGQTMEQRCMDEFWSKHLVHLQTLTAHAMDPVVAMREFRAYLDSCYTRFSDVYLVCDNAGFDFGNINAYLDRAGEPTLFYRYRPDRSLEYVCLHDSDAYGRGLLRQQFNDPWMSNARVLKYLGVAHVDLEAHDHMPENDAEVIYRVHWNTVMFQKLKSTNDPFI